MLLVGAASPMETFTGQITPDCLCVHRKKPYSEPISYPLWKEGEDNAAKLRKHGYFVVRGLLTNQEVEETKTEISRVVSGWYESQAQKVEKDGTDWEEIANRCVHVHVHILYCDGRGLSVLLASTQYNMI